MHTNNLEQKSKSNYTMKNFEFYSLIIIYFQFSMALVYKSLRFSASLGHTALPVVTTTVVNFQSSFQTSDDTLSIHLE